MRKISLPKICNDKELTALKQSLKIKLDLMFLILFQKRGQKNSETAFSFSKVKSALEAKKKEYLLQSRLLLIEERNASNKCRR